MFGNSYVGATQWLAAIARPPHLAAIAPTVTAADYHEGWTYQGGAFELGFNGSWGASLALAQLARAADWRADDPAVQRQLDAMDGLGGALWTLPLGDLPATADLLGYYSRLAGPSRPGRLLAAPAHRRPSRAARLASVPYRRLVRHLPGRNTT